MVTASMCRSPLTTASGPSTTRESEQGHRDHQADQTVMDSPEAVPTRRVTTYPWPTTCAGQAEDDGEERGVRRAAERHDRQAHQADEDAHLLAFGRALVEGERGDDHGEDHLDLHDEGGEARWHTPGAARGRGGRTGRD